MELHVSKESKPIRFIFSCSPALLRELDEWRRKQPDLPSRAEGVRRLLKQGLGV